MGIERGTLGDKKAKKLFEMPKEMSMNGKSRKNRRRQKKMSPVQRLYDTCCQVFASVATNIVPPPQDIEKLRLVIGLYSQSNNQSYLHANLFIYIILVYSSGSKCKT